MKSGLFDGGWERGRGGEVAKGSFFAAIFSGCLLSGVSNDGGECALSACGEMKCVCVC